MALDVVMLIGVGVKLDDAVDPVHIRTGISFYSAYTVFMAARYTRRSSKMGVSTGVEVCSTSCETS
jgi:hypothetical protein